MLRKIISLFLSLSLIITQPIFAQGVAQLNLAQYLGQARPAAIDIFQPTQLRYFSYDDINNSFRILLDKGDAKEIKDNQLKQEAKELMDYFLIGLTLPNDAFWVNLRPDSPDSIIDPALERTDLGRILLEADLQLKKDTAGLTSPQTVEGKAYWDKLYKKAGELFGTENITIPTITRPWIVPGEIIVRESGNSAYIYKANLKVMLESDYLISRGGSRTAPTPDQYAFSDPRIKELNEYSSQIIRETIVPKLIQEVNSSKRYAKLRQVYYSLVLSRWFKQKYSSLRSIRVPEHQSASVDYISLIDSGNLTNLIAKEPYDKLTYFKQYQESFAKGEYNLKEPVYTPYGQSIRSYMSGGFNGTKIIIAGVNAPETAGSSILGESLKNRPGFVPLEISGNMQIELAGNQEQSKALAASPMVLADEVTVIQKVREKLNEHHSKSIKDFSEVALSDLISAVDRTVEEAKQAKVNKEIEKWLDIAEDLLWIQDKVEKNIKIYGEELANFYANIGQKPGIKLSEELKSYYARYAQTIKAANDPDEIIAAAEQAYKLTHGAASPMVLNYKPDNLSKEIFKVCEYAFGRGMITSDEHAIIEESFYYNPMLAAYKLGGIIKNKLRNNQAIKTSDAEKYGYVFLFNAKDLDGWLHWLSGEDIAKIRENIEDVLAGILSISPQGSSLWADIDAMDEQLKKIKTNSLDYISLIVFLDEAIDIIKKRGLTSGINRGSSRDDLEEKESELKKILYIAFTKAIISKIYDTQEFTKQILVENDLYINNFKSAIKRVKSITDYEYLKLSLALGNLPAQRKDYMVFNPGVVPTGKLLMLELKKSMAELASELQAVKDAGADLTSSRFRFIHNKPCWILLGALADMQDNIDKVMEGYNILTDAGDNSEGSIDALVRSAGSLHDAFWQVRGYLNSIFIKRFGKSNENRLEVLKDSYELYGGDRVFKSPKEVLDDLPKRYQDLYYALYNSSVALKKYEDRCKILRNVWGWYKSGPVAAASPVFFTDNEKRELNNIINEVRAFNLEYIRWVQEKHPDQTIEEVKRYMNTVTNNIKNDIELEVSKIKSFIEEGKLKDEKFVIKKWESLESRIKEIKKSIKNNMQKEFKNISVVDKTEVEEFNKFMEKNWLLNAATYVGFVILSNDDPDAGNWRQLAKDIIDYRLGSSQQTSASSITSELEISAFPKNPLGGIDFTSRAMKIGLERMGSFVSSALVLPEIANVAAINLDNEFKQIQLMASSGIRPSDERILEFEAACYYRGEFGARLGEITACLQQAHFLDERLGRESSEALRLATILPEVL